MREKALCRLCPPTAAVEPSASPETEAVAEHAVGDRYEGIVTLDGMEQTVRYEQIRNDRLGFEMGYNYERFERHSEADRERFILKDFLDQLPDR